MTRHSTTLRKAAAFGLAAYAVGLAGITGWGTLALTYVALPGPLRFGCAALFASAGLAAVIALALPRWRRRLPGLFLLASAGLMLGWLAIEPSNDRDWQADVAVLARADIDGDLITVRNIRNFDYRTEHDYTPAWYDKTFDLRKLHAVDLIAVYWMGPAIAHTFLSFGFEGGDRLAISIETRKEKGEAYSTLAGFFRQYELYYVVADERDVIRLRTNYRDDPPEEVHVYRINGPMDNARRLFLAYMRRINELAESPEFYNTLTTNCTTSIWALARINPGHPRLSWKILASGHLPEYLHEAGRLEGNLPFHQLERASVVNARARAADAAPDFSRRIRAGIPGMAADE